MVPNLNAIVARKHGVAPEVVRSRNMIMERMEHNVRTSHGDSRGIYKQEHGDAQLAGETQGKGDVASIWSLLSQLILDTHQHMHPGIKLFSVDKSRCIEKNNDAFVDDCDGVASIQKPTFAASERATRKHLQAGAQLWAELIRATGGAIAFHKSFWQMLAFDGTQFPPAIKNQPHGSIVLKDAYGYESKIEKMKSNEPNKGLGCRQAVDGNMTQEHAFRLGQSKKYVSKIGSARLTLRESRHLMEGRIIPSISYPMAVTTFDQDQCHDLNKPIDRVLLNKMKVNRNMPKAVVYAPKHMAGLNYKSFQTLQDQKGILTMLQHFRWNGAVANDLLVTLSAVQLMAGLCKPILQDTKPDLSYLNKGWFLHQRSRLAHMNAEMWIEHQWTPQLQRVRDESLMSTFISIPGITKSKLAKANWCRIYMRIFTIAELSDERGDFIPGGRTNGNWRAKSTLVWPNITQPPDAY